jgi:hypothetical protein
MAECPRCGRPLAISIRGPGEIETGPCDCALTESEIRGILERPPDRRTTIEAADDGGLRIPDGGDGLTFPAEHVQAILDGSKRVTVRYKLAADRRPDPGGSLTLLDEDGEQFAHTSVEWTGTMTARTYVRDDWTDHRNYRTVGQLLSELRQHYPDAELAPSSELTVIKFCDVLPIYNYQYDTRSPPDDLRADGGSDPSRPAARIRTARKKLRIALDDVDDHAAAASIRMGLDATHDALDDLGEPAVIDPTDPQSVPRTDGGPLDVSQGLLIELDSEWHHSTSFDGRTHETACGLETSDAPWTIRRPPADPDGERCDQCFPTPVTNGGRDYDAGEAMFPDLSDNPSDSLPDGVSCPEYYKSCSQSWSYCPWCGTGLPTIDDDLATDGDGSGGDDR